MILEELVTPEDVRAYVAPLRESSRQGSGWPRTRTQAEITEAVQEWNRLEAEILTIMGQCPATDVPCPAWCGLPAGHAYTSVTYGDDGVPTYYRSHDACHVQLIQDEYNREGVVTLGPIIASLGPNGDQVANAAEARRMAAEANRLADLLEQLPPPPSA